MATPEAPHERRPRFVRTRRGRLIGGVCSGLGEHLGVDPLLLRIAFVGLAFLAGAGVWLYLAILLLSPEEGARRAPIRLLGSSWQIVLTALAVIAAVAVLIAVLSHALFASTAGFAVAVGFVALAGAVAALLWARLRGRRRASADLRLAENLARVIAVGAGLALLAVAGGALAGTGRHVAAWAVLALGVGLVLLALTRARWPVLAVGAFVLPIVVFAAAGVDLHGGLGERVYRPHALGELRSRYQLGAGKLELDLRDVRFPAGSTALRVRLGVGELVVIVPRDVCVLTRTRLGAGFVGVLGGESNGLDIDWHNRPSPPVGTRVLELEGRVGLGAVFVVDRPLEGRYQAGAYGSDEACLDTSAATP